MMTTIVEVFGAFGLTVSEKKTETLLMRAPQEAESTRNCCCSTRRVELTSSQNSSHRLGRTEDATDKR